MGPGTVHNWSLEVDAAEEDTHLYRTADHIFTLIFLLEWIPRVVCEGVAWFLDWGNLFDTFLVWICGIFPAWVVPLLEFDSVTCPFMEGFLLRQCLSRSGSSRL